MPTTHEVEGLTALQTRILQDIHRGWLVRNLGTSQRWVVAPKVVSLSQAGYERARYSVSWSGELRPLIERGLLGAGADGFFVTEKGAGMVATAGTVQGSLELSDPPPSVPIDTSEEAAANVEKKAGAQRYTVLQMLESTGGLTADAISVRTGWDGNTVRPRLWELEQQSLVRKTGAKRKTRTGSPARVYEITERGKAALGNWSAWRVFRRPKAAK
jgi:hypothetical protein